MTDGLILGIDVGQTSTKSLLAREDGQVVGHGEGGPADHFHARGGVTRNRAVIHEAIRSAYAVAGRAPGSLVSVALGVTGLHRDSPEIAIVKDIVREVVEPHMLNVYPDYVANLVGASRGEWGVAVIAGGGSIAYGTSRDRLREGIAGGFGYLLGDEGSAFDIGRRAVMAAARASDGRGEGTVLEAVVCAEFSLVSMPEIMRVVYDASFSRDRLSRLAPRVVDAAKGGDLVAHRILLHAARELARTSAAVVRQIAEPAERVPVYVTGGVFRAGSTILVPFERDLRSEWPAAEIRAPDFPPVVGALIQARQAAYPDNGDAWLERVSQTLANQDAAL